MIKTLINKHKTDRKDKHTYFQISYENKCELDMILMELERIGLKWASNTLPTQKKEKYAYIPGYIQLDRSTEHRPCIRHSSDRIDRLSVPTYTYLDIFGPQLPSKQSLMDFLGE